ncbi:alkaline phosphatase family protein [Streptomyces cinnamoneus]|uniref:Phospholipase C, phosphocholine-specific n=1 Tax=Streptomyces cinnamoneus TaxID=53446 RepID=A0A918TUS4_STRCJ|nr:alkaline phosphatase family protein [Streptomyces cinnamoneus]GHC57516.1 phospholipase C, phosphocholine-specific [Streptomyces cinnamoneus]
MFPAHRSNLPESVLRALRRTPAGGGLQAVRHVVLLMQENRSFDHYFGTVPGVRGFSDRNAILLRDGKSAIFDQPAQEGEAVRPFSLADDGSQDQSTVHDWDTQHMAWNSGWYDQWIAAKGRAAMGYYRAEGVPLYHELADTFTLCEAYHCSVSSETTSNRNYFFSGYGGFEPGGGRVKGATAHDREQRRPYDRRGYGWSSYPEWLEQNGKSWKIYQEWDNFYDNNVEFHSEFKRVYRQALDNAQLHDELSLFTFYESLPGLEPQQREEKLRALAAGVGKLGTADQSLYQRGLARSSTEWSTTMGFLREFRKDIEANRLPQVSYLVPPEANSEHPGNSHPRSGEKIVYQVLDALASNPEVWDSTVLFISYDENDGLFDHVPPPVPPRTETDEWAGSQPLGMGARVPLLVISPWSTGGYVCSQVFDHTSQVRFLEEWLGIRQPWISRWRRTVAGDLTSAFDFERTAAPPAVPPGLRRARALPYQPDAHGALGDDHRFRLTLVNSGSSSAHLTLYPYEGLGSLDDRRSYEAPEHFDIRGTDEESFELTGAAYMFIITGPNGFRREFGGVPADRAAGLQVSSQVQTDPRQVMMTVHNPGTDEVIFDLGPTGKHLGTEQHTLRPGDGTTIVWNAEAEHGWYDVTLSVIREGDRVLHRRLMGHIENGKESVSG